MTWCFKFFRLIKTTRIFFRLDGRDSSRAAVTRPRERQWKSDAIPSRAPGPDNSAKNVDYPVQVFYVGRLKQSVVHQNFSGDVPLRALTLSLVNRRISVQ